MNNNQLILKRTDFDSLTELLNFAVNNPANELIRGENARESRSRSNIGFAGTASFEDALAIATNWPEGRKIIENYTKTYTKLWTKFFPGQDFSNYLAPELGGSIPIIENYISGTPEDMLDFRPNED